MRSVSYEPRSAWGPWSSTSPATPPGMRVRTGRFDGFSWQVWRLPVVEEIVRQRHVERHRRAVPPASAVGGNPSAPPGGGHEPQPSMSANTRGVSASRHLALVMRASWFHAPRPARLRLKSGSRRSAPQLRSPASFTPASRSDAPAVRFARCDQLTRGFPPQAHTGRAQQKSRLMPAFS
jgi:hypothetical protein